ncbi:hypothetical protein QAD02_020456 [Eretmocerus hayati]|uniref:Uncharacterized protein n=1 Tax=Eretmocerus hayati TaxID=131215 RepID=A0ACC2PNH5_9HYME|nr:hypothetical protein QAD02_020456 [Eretmocerus hayati]
MFVCVSVHAMTSRSAPRCNSKFDDNHKPSTDTLRHNSNAAPTNDNTIRCHRCNGNHLANRCKLPPHIEWNFCHRKGHIAAACLQRENEAHDFEASPNMQQESDEMLQVYNFLQIEHSNQREKFTKILQVNDKDVEFEVDSGTAVTIMNKTAAKQFFKGLQMHTTGTLLTSYCDQRILSCGFINVELKCLQHRYD